MFGAVTVVETVSLWAGHVARMWDWECVRSFVQKTSTEETFWVTYEWVGG